MVLDGNAVRSVDRAAALLLALGESQGEAGVTELARRLGLHKSTASRLLATLQKRGLVEQDDETGKYRLGLVVIRLAERAERTLDLRGIALPELERLARLTHETTGLGILEGDTMLAVAQVDGPNLIAVGDWTGRATPLHCVASGKVLLSSLAEREVLRIVRRGLVSYTERTIVELEPLLEELARIRRRGYAMAIGEYELNLNAVAAPVHDARGNVIAAVDIWGPAFRVTPRRVPELAAQAREAAAAISIRLGGTARAADAGPRHRLTRACTVLVTRHARLCGDAGLRDETVEHHLGVLRRGRPAALLIVLVALIALRLARLFVHGDRQGAHGPGGDRRTAQELSAVELKKRMDTLDALATNVLQFFIVIIAGLMVLGRLGVDIGPAVAGLGVVGIAVGFGAQFLVRDYLSGALILIENQYGRGDVVRLAGVSGTVEDFTLRRTTLRDLDGVVHTVPNGEIHVASNLTRVWSRINQDVTVAYGTDIDKAIEVVDNVGREMAGDPVWKRRVLEAPRVERVSHWSRTGSRSRSSARSAPPTSGPPPATCASASSPRSRNTASRSRARNASS